MEERVPQDFIRASVSVAFRWLFPNVCAHLLVWVHHPYYDLISVFLCVCLLQTKWNQSHASESQGECTTLFATVFPSLTHTPRHPLLFCFIKIKRHLDMSAAVFNTSSSSLSFQLDLHVIFPTHAFWQFSAPLICLLLSLQHTLITPLCFYYLMLIAGLVSTAVFNQFRDIVLDYISCFA